jgi:hypothetical protein
LLACHAWLRTDWLVRAGFTLETTADGGRWAVRDGRRFDLDPGCACGQDVCPPHPITYLSLKEAA